MTALLLKPASASRPSGEWGEDDYDVLEDGAVVGRIVKAAAVPVGKPWMWTVLFGLPRGSDADARLCRDARGIDGRVRQELAAAMTAASGPRWRSPSTAHGVLTAFQK
jgi:hypothetical protein